MLTVPNGLADRFRSLFSSRNGQTCYERVCETILTCGMAERLRGGTLIGFSGGADSVFLLGFLLTAREREEKIGEVRLSGFPIAVCHVHHGIRGAEADADLAFSEAVCRETGVEFFQRKADVPALAKERKIGLEETARIERYRIFDAILAERPELCTVALAHNATDLAETFLFRLMRGAGTDGLCGIPPVRDAIVRPLLNIPSAQIRSLLDQFAIPYATDSTNNDLFYSRNFIRHEILPLLRRLNPDPEEAVARAVRNLSEDRDCLSALSADFFRTHTPPYSAEDLASLPSAVFYRVFAGMCAPFGFSPEECHVRSAFDGLSKRTAFAISLPLGYVFSSDGKTVKIAYPEENTKKEPEPIIFPPCFGQNSSIEFFEIPKYGATVAVADSEKAFPEFWQNIYKIAIQADLTSAIIDEGLLLRFRRAGDAYYYKGMTHKLKKMMNDKSVPPHLRSAIPVFADRRGILWVPGFGTRDDGVAGTRKIAVYLKNTPIETTSLHIPYRGIFFTEETPE